MKRLFILISIISVLCCALSAVDTQQSYTRSFRIQAGVGEKVSVNVDRIPAQSTSYVAGMPFNIEEDFVQYTNPSFMGRLIANIDIIANTKYDLEITAQPMHHTTMDSVDLNYILTFEYTIGYEGASNSTLSTFRCNSGSPQYWRWDDEIGASVAPGSYVGNIDGNIYFKFDDSSSSQIRTLGDAEGELPPGNYSSTVTIVVKTDSIEGGEV